MNRVALVLCSLAMLACQKPFLWNTDSGIECELSCDAGVCPYPPIGLRCNRAPQPGLNCSDFNTGTHTFAACWTVERVSTTSVQPEVSSDVMGLCQVCCCENCSGSSAAIPTPCELLSCSAETETPPSPLACVGGRVVLTRSP